MNEANNRDSEFLGYEYKELSVEQSRVSMYLDGYKMCIRDSEMAEPGILGVNAGAGLFIAAFMVFLPQSGLKLTLLLPVLAFAGSLAAAALDYRLALTRQGLSPKRLLLIGIATVSYTHLRGNVPENIGYPYRPCYGQRGGMT